MIKPDTVSTIEAGRLLVLLPGYCAPKDNEPFRDGGALSNWWVNKLASSRSDELRQHVRFYRDFYANPRTPAYMAARAGELVARSKVGTAIALLDPSVNLPPADLSWASEVTSLPLPLRDCLPAGFRIDPSTDAALLLHSDPLGMGLAALERDLIRQFPGRVFVLNGRRRTYRLDRRMSGALRRRRVVAETRILEGVATTLVRPVAAVLALRDRRGGRV